MSRRRSHGKRPGTGEAAAASEFAEAAEATQETPDPAAPIAAVATAVASAATPRPPRARGRSRPRQAPRPVETAGAADAEAGAEDTTDGGERKPACTLAQMRRFIKSRPYVPVHELRRRFEIEGVEDDVSPLQTEQGTYYVGLPQQEAGYLGDLIKAGEVGYELLLDPTSPALVGVFPMRPVARQ